MTGSNSLPERYFRWLYDQVFPVEQGVTPFVSYLLVCEIMHNTAFKIIVPRDSNRVADAALLRNSFMKDAGGEPLDRADVVYPDASIFEVLVALALRAQLMIDISPKEMFNIFLSNLRIADCYDETSVIGIRSKVQVRLRKFNDRRYIANGRGGLFPLRTTTVDQRGIELWYQMGAYMTENRMY